MNTITVTLTFDIDKIRPIVHEFFGVPEDIDFDITQGIAEWATDFEARHLVVSRTVSRTW